MKIELDKYYTPIEKSIELIEFTLDFIGRNKIDTIIEPSAGNGSFSNYLFDKYSDVYKIYAFDIKPEEERIKEQDFLKLSNFRYNDKCLIIGNPPFGKSNNLVTAFINKSIKLSKYVAFIIPISYLTDYKYNSIYGEDLNVMKYSDRDVHCCFKIYDKQSINQSIIIKKYLKYFS
jgi:predicted RNA methylase